MSEVLKRKLSAKSQKRASKGVSVEAVLRKIMPRDADTVLSLTLSVLEATSGAREREDVLNDIGPQHLAFLLESEAGLRGVVTLDPGLFSAVVEVQLSGRVTENAMGERSPTRTDAIVVSEIVDTWLMTAEAAMAETGLEAAWPISGFERIPGHLNRREVELLLEPVEFRTVDIKLSLGGGTKTGVLCLATPRLDASHDGHVHSTAARVRTHLPDLPVALHAVLAHLPLDMSRAQAIAPETVLPLPEKCLQNVRLETSDGKLIHRARLGQLDGKRAVRLGGANRAAAAALLTASAMPPPPTEALAPAALPEPPALPDIPGATSEPEGLPDLPDLPPPGELPDLPDLPDLPELPDLPDLP